MFINQFNFKQIPHNCNFLRYFLGRIKVDYKLFLGRVHIHSITNLLPQINFENNFLLEAKVIKLR